MGVDAIVLYKASYSAGVGTTVLLSKDVISPRTIVAVKMHSFFLSFSNTIDTLGFGQYYDGTPLAKYSSSMVLDGSRIPAIQYYAVNSLMDTVFRGSYLGVTNILLKSSGVFYSNGIVFSKQINHTYNAQTVSTTLTGSNLLSRIITGTHAAGATQTYTLPTGEDMDAAIVALIDEPLPRYASFDWSVINLSAAAVDTITIAANTGHIVVGNMVVQSAHSTTGGIYGSSAMFRSYKEGTSAWCTYRIG
jgi:hypothetical protein